MHSVSDGQEQSFAHFNSDFSGEVIFVNKDDHKTQDEIRVPGDLVLKLADMILYSLFSKLPETMQKGLRYGTGRIWNQDGDAVKPIKGKNMVRIDRCEIWFYDDLSLSAVVRNGNQEKIIQAGVLKNLVRQCIGDLFGEDWFEGMPECPWKETVST